jgi:glutathione S-transferase
MTFPYVSVEDAIAARGLRMVVVGNVPSPWGEAAKGIFHIKRIPFSAVRLVYDNDALKSWAGQLSAPVAVYEDESPRAGWAEILMLAERLAPKPGLLPMAPEPRGKALLLAEKFCGQGGIGWTRRLQLVHSGLEKTGGFGERVATFLGGKYGYDPGQAEANAMRLRTLLRETGAALREQRSAGPYYLGQTPSAVDVYSAAFMALFAPLPQAQCAMHPAARAAFEWLDDETRAAIDPLLLEHRDMMYARHLELPLSL